MTPATIRDIPSTPKRIEVCVGTSRVYFVYGDEDEHKDQLARARKYLADAQKAGAELKIKEKL